MTPAGSRAAAPAPEVEQLQEFARAMVGLAVRTIGAVDGEVSLTQFRSLAVLERLGSCNVSGLAAELGLHVSTVTRLCDKLVQQGLITREVRPDNRREYLLANTAAGRRLVAKVWRAREVELETALGRLSAQQRALVARALPVLLDALGEDADGPEQAWG